MESRNLYAIRVGSVGSFFAAAVDVEQARWIGEAWAADRLGARTPTPRIIVKRHTDPRPVYAIEDTLPRG